MKKYNLFELILSVLSWATWIAMFGLLLGGYWYAPFNEPEPMKYALKGVTMMRSVPNHPAMIISYIALGLLFLANVINHLIKLKDRDGHNIIFQAVVLVYAIPYLICLFVIGFPEVIAWYPFSFFLCYVVGGIADILFARFCSLESEDLDLSARPHRTHKKRAGRAFNAPSLSFGRYKRDDYAVLLNNDRAIELMREKIMKRIREDADVEFDHEINYYALCQKSVYDVKKQLHFADYIIVGVDLLASDLNWFYKYVIDLCSKDMFADTRRVLSDNQASISDLIGAKGNTQYAYIKSRVEAAARRELSEKCDYALNRLKMVIESVLKDETNCMDNMWIATCYRDDIKDTFAYIKNLGGTSVELSKKADITVGSSQLDYAIKEMLKKSFDLFVEYENNREDDEEDYLDMDEPKRYVIIDSKTACEELSTVICLYIGDRLDEAFPDNNCSLAQELPITIAPSDIVKTDDDKYYRHIRVDIHFAKSDVGNFRGFCIACNDGSDEGDYFEKGKEFFLAHDIDAIKEYLSDILKEGNLIGLRPWDRSRETWDEDSPVGDEPVRFEPGEMTVEVHWDDLPDQF